MIKPGFRAAFRSLPTAFVWLQGGGYLLSYRSILITVWGQFSLCERSPTHSLMTAQRWRAHNTRHQNTGATNCPSSMTVIKTFLHLLWYFSCMWSCCFICLWGCCCCFFFFNQHKRANWLTDDEICILGLLCCWLIGVTSLFTTDWRKAKKKLLNSFELLP